MIDLCHEALDNELVWVFPDLVWDPLRGGSSVRLAPSEATLDSAPATLTLHGLLAGL